MATFVTVRPGAYGQLPGLRNGDDLLDLSVQREADELVLGVNWSRPLDQMPYWLVPAAGVATSESALASSNLEQPTQPVEGLEPSGRWDEWDGRLAVRAWDPNLATELPLVAIGGGAAGNLGMHNCWTRYRIGAAGRARLDAVCLEVEFLGQKHRWRVEL